jgi:hypothetical protein
MYVLSPTVTRGKIVGKTANLSSSDRYFCDARRCLANGKLTPCPIADIGKKRLLRLLH